MSERSIRAISNRGWDMIKQFEGLRLHAYPDQHGVWTIGYGHTRGVHKGMVITQEQADAFLIDDLAEAEDCVVDHVKVELNDNQYAALVSFTFNEGCGKFRGSTLLMLLNEGKYTTVPDQLKRWVWVGSNENTGLRRRRAVEAELWNTPV